jgi:peptidoglycan/LPS O-acetylase OafA/YrhL
MLDSITASPFTLVGVAAVYLAAMATLRHGVGKIVPEPGNDRYASIDGLRGLLAILVLSHHSLYWYAKLTTGSWQMPSILYENLGKSSVCLFFMVSSFLFFSKIISTPDTQFDWSRFAISRVLRLTPLYFCAIAILVLEVAITSHWHSNTSIHAWITSILSWLGFTVFGQPDINQVPSTSLIIAGVTWSLVYEWIFYAALPLIALLSTRRVPLSALLISTAASLILYRIVHPNPLILMAFLGGIVAAVIVRWGKINGLLKSPWLAPIAVFLLYRSFTLHYNPWNLETLILLTIVFTVIAAGNSIFGLLQIPVSRKLGEISYGIYLFHGLILYATLQLTPIGRSAAIQTPSIYLVTILAVTVFTVFLSSIGFRLIEAPAMALVTPLATQWRQRWAQIRQS